MSKRKIKKRNRSGARDIFGKDSLFGPNGPDEIRIDWQPTFDLPPDDSEYEDPNEGFTDGQVLEFEEKTIAELGKRNFEITLRTVDLNTLTLVGKYTNKNRLEISFDDLATLKYLTRGTGLQILSIRQAENSGADPQ